MMKKPRILCIVGPSGSGKTTIEQMLCHPDICAGYSHIVSYTTRPKREGELNGREHLFVRECRCKHSDMLAYTQYGDYEYWADGKMLEEDKINTYVIDADGFRFLRRNYGTKCTMVVLYVQRSDLSMIDAKRRKRDELQSKLFAGETDFVIRNDGTLDELQEEVTLYSYFIKKLFRKRERQQ